MRLWCPNEIDVVMHYHCRCDPHPRQHAPAVQEAIEFFLREGILDTAPPDDGRGYLVTKRGEAWIELILSTPMPESAWVDPRTRQEVAFT